MSDASETDGGGYRTIHDLAGDERPREKLLRHGPVVLSDAELIAIIVGSGIRGENVIDLARRLLESHGGLGGLLRTDPKALQRTRGLGPAKAAQLAAAIELGRRMPHVDSEARPLLTSPEAIYEAVRGRFQGRSREELHILTVDSGGRQVGTARVIPGNVHSTPFHMPDLFRDAMVHDATGIILVHNHPSGRATPSPRDIQLTREIADLGAGLQIKLYDHVVIAGERFVSMQREGLLGG